ncbi:hypothetical protein ZIOFF_012419 [Zingiber officinale]|uniref:Uncharacterized protein n=1 Tax=Zingiber officinale TaxID=94328 RepID=A0A8J5I7Y7_ZINOF|nr:hypothetical protein ZIOFF_012419 [Zingiber officinale]
MSTRPVPTRESPWGIHESDTIELKAHRCNDRLEDIVQPSSLMRAAGLDGKPGWKRAASLEEEQQLRKLFFGRRLEEGSFFRKLFFGRRLEEGSPFLSLMLRGDDNHCWEEPTEPFYYLELDPPKRPETESE